MAVATRSGSDSWVTKWESSAKGSKDGSDDAEAAAMDDTGGEEDKTAVLPLDAADPAAATDDEPRYSEVALLYPDPTPAPSMSIKSLK